MGDLIIWPVGTSPPDLEALLFAAGRSAESSAFGDLARKLPAKIVTKHKTASSRNDASMPEAPISELRSGLKRAVDTA